jgi:hypothetical protein
VQVAVARRPDRLHLGVGAADLLVPAFGDRLAVDCEHGADEGVRADLPTPVLGQLDRAREVPAIDLCLQLHRARGSIRRPARPRQSLLTAVGGGCQPHLPPVSR